VAVGRMSCIVSWPSQDALPRDVFENTFHFTTAARPTVTDATSALGLLNTFYNVGAPTPITAYYSAFVGTLAVVKFYDEDEVRAPGVARTILYESNMARAAASSASAVPEEVALCLSYSSTGNIAKHRGRIYLGPWNVGVLQTGSDFDGTNKNSRPLTALMEAIQHAALTLVDTGPTAGATWCVRSGIGSGTKAAPVVTYETITHAFVDNEWDSQRRRRIAATQRLLVP
jgi:hypothetical protein